MRLPFKKMKFAGEIFSNERMNDLIIGWVAPIGVELEAPIKAVDKFFKDTICCEPAIRMVDFLKETSFYNEIKAEFGSVYERKRIPLFLRRTQFLRSCGEGRNQPKNLCFFKFDH